VKICKLVAKLHCIQAATQTQKTLLNALKHVTPPAQPKLLWLFEGPSEQTASAYCSMASNISRFSFSRSSCSARCGMAVMEMGGHYASRQWCRVARPGSLRQMGGHPNHNLMSCTNWQSHRNQQPSPYRCLLLGFHLALLLTPSRHMQNQQWILNTNCSPALTAAFSLASSSRCRRSCSATQRLRSFSSRRFSACGSELSSVQRGQ